jgi:hypothetical protein
MKIPPVGAELFHPDKRAETDVKTLIDAFRGFETAPMFRPYVALLLACNLF